MFLSMATLDLFDCNQGYPTQSMNKETRIMDFNGPCFNDYRNLKKQNLQRYPYQIPTRHPGLAISPAAQGVFGRGACGGHACGSENCRGGA